MRYILSIQGYVFLHGTLLFDVNSADDLPDMESWIAKVIDGKGGFDTIGSIELYIFVLIICITLNAKLTHILSYLIDVTDPFVDVRLENAKLAKTSVILNDLNPRWNESFNVELCHWGANLSFEVRDKDHAYAEYIGMVQIPAPDLIEAGRSGSSYLI